MKPDYTRARVRGSSTSLLRRVVSEIDAMAKPIPREMKKLRHEAMVELDSRRDPMAAGYCAALKADRARRAGAGVRR